MSLRSSLPAKKPLPKATSMSKLRAPGQASPVKAGQFHIPIVNKDRNRPISGPFLGRAQQMIKTDRSENSTQQTEFPIKNGFQTEMIIRDDKTIDLSITNLLAEELPRNKQRETRRKQLGKEVVQLKKDLAMKNTIVENLMQENSELRNQMDAFMSKVDQTQNDISVHLDECNKKIVDLESEVQKLREENKLYQAKLQKPQQITQEQPKINNLIGLDAHIDNINKLNNSVNNKALEDFFFQLTEKTMDYMEFAKRKFEQFDRNMHETVLQPERAQTPILPFPLSKAGSFKKIEVIKVVDLRTKTEMDLPKRFPTSPSREFSPNTSPTNKNKSRPGSGLASPVSRKQSKTQKIEDFGLKTLW